MMFVNNSMKVGQSSFFVHRAIEARQVREAFNTRAKKSLDELRGRLVAEFATFESSGVIVSEGERGEQEALLAALESHGKIFSYYDGSFLSDEERLASFRRSAELLLRKLLLRKKRAAASFSRAKFSPCTKQRQKTRVRAYRSQAGRKSSVSAASDSGGGDGGGDPDSSDPPSKHSRLFVIPKFEKSNSFFSSTLPSWLLSHGLSGWRRAA